MLPAPVLYKYSVRTKNTNLRICLMWHIFVKGMVFCRYPHACSFKFIVVNPYPTVWSGTFWAARILNNYFGSVTRPTHFDRKNWQVEAILCRKGISVIADEHIYLHTRYRTVLWPLLQPNETIFSRVSFKVWFRFWNKSIRLQRNGGIFVRCTSKVINIIKSAFATTLLCFTKMPQN